MFSAKADQLSRVGVHPQPVAAHPGIDLLYARNMHSACYTSLFSKRMLSQAEKRQRQIEDDIEKLNPQDSIGPLPETTRCTSAKPLRSSFGVLYDKTIRVCAGK